MRPRRSEALRAPLYNRRLRQVGEHQARDQAARATPSWWANRAVQEDRDKFREAAGARAQELLTDKDAAKVKTKLNFVD